LLSSKLFFISSNTGCTSKIDSVEHLLHLLGDPTDNGFHALRDSANFTTECSKVSIQSWLTWHLLESCGWDSILILVLGLLVEGLSEGNNCKTVGTPVSVIPIEEGLEDTSLLEVLLNLVDAHGLVLRKPNIEVLLLLTKRLLCATSLSTLNSALILPNCGHGCTSLAASSLASTLSSLTTLALISKGSNGCNSSSLVVLVLLEHSSEAPSL
jgi:hypothetical protein